MFSKSEEFLLQALKKANDELKDPILRCFLEIRQYSLKNKDYTKVEGIDAKLAEAGFSLQEKIYVHKK